ncbi:MAG TPA: endonuclease/exonuclease/phosphatase family protein [Vicinamibacterales bacterium]|jgi:endonuclease/exonuclease/phosphatase family metal-dependent hydrolase
MRVLGLAALLTGACIASAPVEASTSCTPMPVAARPAPTSHHQSQPHGLSVASLNMAGRADIADELAAWAQQRAIDVLLLQEVGAKSVDGGQFIAALSDRLGFHSVYAPADLLGNGQTQGLAIVSRNPIDDAQIAVLSHHHLRFRSRCRIALAATVSTADGPVRIVNVHLDTRINTEDRLAQLAPILVGLEHDQHPQIIGGDFNTMDVGWFQSMWPLPYAQHQARAVRTLMADEGFHTPFVETRATFKLMGLPLKLDWLFLKGINALEWSVDEAPLSDHRGVWARVTPTERGNQPSVD